MNLKDFSAIQQVIINEELNRLWNDNRFTREMLEFLASEILKKIRG